MSEPYHPTRMEEYVAHCALWRTDAGFRSTIQLSNQLEVAEIDAIPTIYMADGTAWELPPVHLAKSGVQTVDVNDALAGAPESVRAHLSGYGSASVRYKYDWQGAVYATMTVMDVARSLDYLVPFVFLPGQGSREHTPAELREFRDSFNARRYEGLWFRNSRSAGGWVALSNTSNATLQVQVQLSGLRNPVEQTYSLPKRSTELLDLGSLFGADSVRTGGITITQSGPPGALQVAGGLEDLSTGYSTDMPLTPQKTKPGSVGERQYASVGIMVNEQDPLLGFPSGLVFWPYAFFRNLASQPRTLRFGVYYMEGRRVKSLMNLPDLTLGPGEAKEFPLRELMLKQPQVPDLNLAFSYTGDWGDIVAGAGSVESTGNYVFPVPPSPVSPSGSKSSIYWRAAGGTDTMYTVWNPLDRPQQLLVTLHFGANGETYRLPLLLEPYASAMIDVGELIRTRQPDQDGKLLPSDVQHGSLVLSSAAAEPEDLITAVLSGGIYNPQKATCMNECETCNGWTSPWFDVGLVPFAVSTQNQSRFGYVWYTGSRYDTTSVSNWSSDTTPVATVQTQGQTTPGLVNGVSPGTAGITAFYPNTPPNVGQICYQGNQPPCPIVPYPTAGANETVQPTVSIQGPSYLYIGHDPVVTTYRNSMSASGRPSGGSYSWSSSDPSMSFDSTTAASTHITATSYSGGVGDTRITVNYTQNNQPAAPASLWITKREFRYLGNDMLFRYTTYYTNPPNPQVRGYEYVASYNVFTAPGRAQVTDGNGISVSEGVTVISHNVSFNPNYGYGSLNANSEVSDTLGLVSNSALPSDLLIVDSQDIGVGGFYVRTNRLTYTATGVTVSSQGP